MRRKAIARGLAALALSCWSGLALADCSITGAMTATQNITDPLLPTWTYSLTVTWDTGTPYALSHFDILLDAGGEVCTCGDFAMALEWPQPAGASDGEGMTCLVPYDLELECLGDPSIDLQEIILKFEPREMNGCEPGATGTGTFTILSDVPPAPIAEPNLFLVDKHGQLVCHGQLSGVFPSLPCDPTEARASSWGCLKSGYR